MDALDPLRRWRAIRRHAGHGLRRRYPETAEELRASRLFRERWYYSVELLPGVVTPGPRPHDLPMLPRMLLRHCEVSGQSCLDVGTMEGVIPVLLRKRGAREVLGVDFSNYALGRLAAVQHYHGVSFDYRSVGLLYDLGDRLARRSFDIVNLAGILYHVFSPLSLLAAVRPLIKRQGILIIGTYVTLDPEPVMDFNAAGRMWSEGNTFWFPSVRLLDYLLRYLRLLPIDCLFRPDEDMRGPEFKARNSDVDLGKDSGYLAVTCRAVDSVEEDDWMTESARSSWEYNGLVDWRRVDSRPTSSVTYDGAEPTGGVDLHAAVLAAEPVRRPAPPEDGHILLLEATS